VGRKMQSEEPPKKRQRLNEMEWKANTCNNNEKQEKKEIREKDKENNKENNKEEQEQEQEESDETENGNGNVNVNENSKMNKKDDHPLYYHPKEIKYPINYKRRYSTNHIDPNNKKKLG